MAAVTTTAEKNGEGDKVERQAIVPPVGDSRGLLLAVLEKRVRRQDFIGLPALNLSN